LSSSAKADDPVFTDASDELESRGVLDTPLSRGMTVNTEHVRHDRQTPVLKLITSPQSGRVSTQPTLPHCEHGNT
jgi:hypothetical protein